MSRSRLLLPVLLVALSGLTGVSFTPAAAAPTAEGREWRELYQTTGLSWAQIASVCPTDGATPCSGSVGGRDLSGWIWGTAPQVLALMDDYAPRLATLDPPVVSGIEGFGGAVGFLGDMRWTTYTSLTYSYSEYAGGWTASTDAAGLHLGGSAGYSHQLTGSTASGSLGLGASTDFADSYTGVFLWRPVGEDVTAPVVTPVVMGTLGNAGWYRSDVAVSFVVSDPESAITSTTGCDPSLLATDSSGTGYTCTATSAPFAGTGSASVTVRRDVTAPTLTCGAAPVFDYAQSPALVSAMVTDGTSGPAVGSVTVAVSTTVVGSASATVSGSDLAGNVSSRSCPYSVRSVSCLGKTITLAGTAAADVLRGTSGADVISGLGGADRIEGLGGNDTICGGDGPDVVYAGAGVDLVDGGAGNDELYGDAGDDDLAGGADSDAIRGDSGYDRCSSGEVRMSSCAVLY